MLPSNIFLSQEDRRKWSSTDWGYNSNWQRWGNDHGWRWLCNHQGAGGGGDVVHGWPVKHGQRAGAGDAGLGHRVQHRPTPQLVWDRHSSDYPVHGRGGNKSYSLDEARRCKSPIVFYHINSNYIMTEHNVSRTHKLTNKRTGRGCCDGGAANHVLHRGRTWAVSCCSWWWWWPSSSSGSLSSRSSGASFEINPQFLLQIIIVGTFKSCCLQDLTSAHLMAVTELTTCFGEDLPAPLPGWARQRQRHPPRPPPLSNSL